jgi:hypothetical protein
MFLLFLTYFIKGEKFFFFDEMTFDWNSFRTTFYLSVIKPLSAPQCPLWKLVIYITSI